MNIKDFILINGAKAKAFLIKNRTKFIDGVEYYFDEIINDGNSIFIKGWIAGEKGGSLNPVIEFKAGEEQKDFALDLYKREDVADNLGLEAQCGFSFEAAYESGTEGRIYVKYYKNGKPGRITAGAIKGNGFGGELRVNQIFSGTAKYSKVTAQILSGEEEIPEEVYKTPVDVIVPVYNGFDYLENLFKTIKKTRMDYRLFIVHDKSTDERVHPFLMEYAAGDEKAYLIENPENLGFVRSVNRALTVSDRDAAIVNTDVVLPDLWLERLMMPIIMREDTASSTPFTNSGTICSFPNFCEDNPLFLGLDADEIDSEFKKIKPVYNEMPTGVGFCMGMKRAVINKIGILNAEVFYKGYGEENDWCQRAIKAGFKNVHVENLFAWHNHGGSFLSEDKKRYIERNLKLLNEMHPGYDGDVAVYCRRDPAKNIREYAKWQLIKKAVKEYYIVFDHNWGGGAASYINGRIGEFSEEGFGTLRIINDINTGLGLYAEIIFGEHKSSFAFDSFDELFEAVKDLSCKEIILNELVSFEDAEEVQGFVLRLKEHFGAKLTMLGHDFYAVCPSIYLMNSENKHCFKPEGEVCKGCFEKNENKFNKNCPSADKWREIWGSFLAECDDIILFSENTKSYFDYWYKDLKNIRVVPHKVDYIEPVREYEKKSGVITIASIGNFMKTKGSDILCEMAEIIKKDGLKARIVIIGPDLENCKERSIIFNGRYKKEELPELIEKYETDIVFIASVWPETFSYTTEEAMKMGVPVAAFDIGAPAERLKNYDKGLIIEEISARAAVDKIMEYLEGRTNG